MSITGEFSLQGRSAIVTGSGRNIGRAIAERLAAAGARVVVNGHRDRDAVDETVERIRAAGGEALAVMADVSDSDDVANLVRQAHEAFGGPNITVCNVSTRPYQAFLDITEGDWDQVIRTNLYSCFHMAQNALPHMIAKKEGRLIHISGMDGVFGNVTHRAHNVTAKAGMHGLAMSLAREFGEFGITANTIAPGPIETVRDWSQYVHQEREMVKASVPLKRYGTTHEIASACLYLASDAGGYVSGHCMHVNGGHSMI